MLGETRNTYMRDNINSSYRYINAESNGGPTGGISEIAGTCFGIVIGSGTTAPTKSDYNLAQRLLSGYTSSGGTINIVDNNLIITQSITANQDNLTINEIGIRCSSQSGDTDYSTLENYCTLMTRTVLDSPVVLNNGETKTITVTIDFNKFIDNVDNT